MSSGLTPKLKHIFLMGKFVSFFFISLIASEHASAALYLLGIALPDICHLHCYQTPYPLVDRLLFIFKLTDGKVETKSILTLGFEFSNV